MRIRNIKLSLILFGTVMTISLLINSCTWDKGELPPDPDPEPQSFCDSVGATYFDVIEPMILTNCATLGCHNSGAQIGDFTLHAGVLQKVDNGSFKARVIEGNPSWMPPAGALSQEELDRIECWLNDGAPNN